MSIGSPNLGLYYDPQSIVDKLFTHQPCTGPVQGCTGQYYWSFIRSLLHTELRVEPCLDLNLYAADLQINPLNAELKGFA